MLCLRQITTLLFLVGMLLPATKSHSNKTNTDIESNAGYSVPALKKMLEKSPDDLNLHLRLGILYYKQNKLDEAITHLRRTNENPTEESLKWSIEAYNKKKDYKELLRNLKILSTMKPRSPKIKSEIARAQIMLGDYDSAIASYKSALSVYKKHLPASWGLVEIYEKQKNMYEMRLVLTDILKYFPRNTRAISKLCQTDTEENFFENAISSCQRAIFLDNKIASNHIYLGLAYKYTNKTQSAMRILTRAAKQFPRSEFAQYVVASLSEDTSNWEAALKYFRQCTTADRKSERCYLGQGRVLLEMKKYKESLSAYVQACNINKSSYSKILEAVGKLRQNRVYTWSNKFKHSARNCGI